MKTTSVHSRKELWEKVDSMICAVDHIKQEVSRYQNLGPVDHLLESLQVLAEEAKVCIEELKRTESPEESGDIIKQTISRP